MSRVLVYTSPARGHLFPVMGVAGELVQRGHDVEIRTLADAVEGVQAVGVGAAAIEPRIEQREMDDWRATSSLGALRRSIATFADRAPLEVADLQGAIEAFNPDVLIVDTNTWGAQAVAEASGLPWMTFQPYFTPLPGPGVPAFGPGLAPMSGVLGRMRDRVVGTLVTGQFERMMVPAYNGVRTSLGLPAVPSIEEMLTRPPAVLYFTVPELEYPRSHWPTSFRFVGPALGGPVAEVPDWLAAIDRPIVLVSCSSERQADRVLVEKAIAELPAAGYFVVATTASHDPDSFDAPTDGVIIERFLPHDAILPRTTVAIGHGGMGITQRAVSHGVPVVVVPFGRDQLEVAQRIQHAGVGVSVPRRRLRRGALTRAVTDAESKSNRARAIAERISAAYGSDTAADAVEELIRVGSRPTT